MKRLSSCLVTVVLYVSSPLIAAETIGDDVEFGVGDGIIATRDGQPGPLLARSIQSSEIHLSDIAVRKLDVIYGRKYGAALTMDVYLPRSKPRGAGVVQIVSGGLWSGPEYRRMQAFMSSIRTLLENGFTVFAVMHSSQPKSLGPRYAMTCLVRFGTFATTPVILAFGPLESDSWDSLQEDISLC